MAGTPASLVMCPGWPGVVGVSGGRFNLANYLASVSGSYWDFTKTDDQFQEATGPTLADDVGESIGLKLDRGLWGGKTLAQVVAGQPELVVNGKFDTDLSGWTSADTGTGVSDWNGGAARFVGIDTNNRAQRRQSFTSVVGSLYRISVDVTQVNSGNMAFRVGFSAGGTDYLADVLTPSPQTVVRYFVAATTTTWVQIHAATNGGNGKIDNVSVKLIPGFAATQSSASLKPTYQSTGGKFDGSDDNLLTSYLAAAGANFIVALVTVPATLAAFQCPVGIINAGSSGRFSIGFATDGKRSDGLVGNTTTFVGTVDRRGTELVVGLSNNGSLGRMFDDDSLVVEAAQSGSVSTAIPFRIGARNFNGTANAFFGGSVKKLVAGYDFLTLARYNQIRTALLAA